MDLDDIRQTYRMKAWYASEKWDPERSTMTQDAFVFSCLKNAEKDLLKRKRRGDVYLEDQRMREPRATHEEVFGEIDEGHPLLPNTLTRVELHAVLLLYQGQPQTEIAPQLGLAVTAMYELMRSIRAKMEDWRPSGVRPGSIREPEGQDSDRSMRLSARA
jgi:DNA-directed RNA polymerase specialized sigma24 family protein